MIRYRHITPKKNYKETLYFVYNWIPDIFYSYASVVLSVYWNSHTSVHLNVKNIHDASMLQSCYWLRVAYDLTFHSASCTVSCLISAVRNLILPSLPLIKPPIIRFLLAVLELSISLIDICSSRKPEEQPGYAIPRDLRQMAPLRQAMMDEKSPLPEAVLWLPKNECGDEYTQW